jgi:acyl-CoA synthetase (NDP forming)
MLRFRRTGAEQSCRPLRCRTKRYAKALEIVSKDPNNDGVLVILTPQAMTEPTATAEQLKRFAKFNGKPILASWMGGDQVRVGEEILNNAGIPTFPYPDTAMRAFAYMWRYADNLRSLYETPAVGADPTTSLPKRSLSGQDPNSVESALFHRGQSKEFSPPMAFPLSRLHRI